jgi:hypothetical protein
MIMQNIVFDQFSLRYYPWLQSFVPSLILKFSLNKHIARWTDSFSLNKIINCLSLLLYIFHVYDTMELNALKKHIMTLKMDSFVEGTNKHDISTITSLSK